MHHSQDYRLGHWYYCPDWQERDHYRDHRISTCDGFRFQHGYWHNCLFRAWSGENVNSFDDIISLEYSLLIFSKRESLGRYQLRNLGRRRFWLGTPRLTIRCCVMAMWSLLYYKYSQRVVYCHIYMFNLLTYVSLYHNSSVSLCLYHI